MVFAVKKIVLDAKKVVLDVKKFVLDVKKVVLDSQDFLVQIEIRFQLNTTTANEKVHDKQYISTTQALQMMT